MTINTVTFLTEIVSVQILWSSSGSNKNLREKKITTTICLFVNVLFVIPYLLGIVMIVTMIFARSTFRIIRREAFAYDLHKLLLHYFS